MKARLPALMFAGLAPSLLVAQDPRAQNGPEGPNEGAPNTTAIPQIVLPGVEQLKITGQYRLRYENRYNYNFDDRVDSNDDFFGQRIRLNFDFKLADDLSAFVQIQDVRDWGEELNTVDDSADGLDIHQGYLRVGETPWVGGATKIGRQVVAFGAQRLIGGLEWLNQGRSFDGVRNTHALGDSEDTLDTFALQIRERLNNADDDDAWLYGGYATFHPGDAVLDAYLIGLNDEGVGVGMSQHRVTLGSRFAKPMGPVDLEFEVATQVGKQGGADVPIGKTYAVHADGVFHLDDDRGAYLRADFDMASGDDPSTADNERFNNLFPTGHIHWGMMDFALWTNLVHGAVEAGFAIDDASTLSATWHLFRAMEGTDRFVGPVNQLSPGGAGFSKDMGNEINLLFNHDLGLENMKGAIQIGYGVFLPGDGVRDANGNDDIAHFFYGMFDFAF